MTDKIYDAIYARYMAKGWTHDLAHTFATNAARRKKANLPRAITDELDKMQQDTWNKEGRD